jgi:putative membrane protein
MASWITFGSALVFLSSVVIGAPNADRHQTAQQIVTELHQTNLMEIHMGQLARERGDSREVRHFGKQLVRDHQRAERKLEQLASREKLQLPSENSPETPDAHLKKLQSLQGTAFDREFASLMAEGHKQALRDVKLASRELKGTPTGRLLLKLTPVLEKHEATAVRLEKKARAVTR